MPALDVTNTRYGMLVTLSPTELRCGNSIVWKCLCDCGVTKNIALCNLRTGATKSCGCQVTIGKITHEMSYTKTYRIWNSMLNRVRDHIHYSARGITCSEDWRVFENFLSDMGECPEGMSLDRIDVNGNYCKENCRWADGAMQQFNKRRSPRNVSGRTGVGYVKKSGKWQAWIDKDGVNYWLGGNHLTFEDAVKAREEGELKYYGYIKE
jgi:hypothetical protein